MLTHLDHIGVAVPDLTSALQQLSFLGSGQPPHTEEVPSQRVRVACIPMQGYDVELLEPTSEDSPISKFLQKRGTGMHHLAFSVTDIEARLRELRERGVQLIDERPRLGANGRRVAFLHPKSTGGILIELCEKI